MRAAKHRSNKPTPAQTSEYPPAYLPFPCSIFPKQLPRPLEAANYILSGKGPDFEVIVITESSYEPSFVEAK